MREKFIEGPPELLATSDIADKTDFSLCDLHSY
jgi:hypothetical protein